jgi:hypothetical protein
MIKELIRRYFWKLVLVMSFSTGIMGFSAAVVFLGRLGQPLHETEKSAIFFALGIGAGAGFLSVTIDHARSKH